MNALTVEGWTLEPQTAAHAEAMFVVLGDPALYEFENEPPASIEWLRERFRRLESRQSADGSERWLNWVIRASDSTLAGFVQATVYRRGDASIAYVLGSSHWGCGLATRSVAAMLSELSANYEVARFVAVLKRENQRSLRLLERLRFAAAPQALHDVHTIESDELLMYRNAA